MPQKNKGEATAGNHQPEATVQQVTVNEVKGTVTTQAKA